MSAGTRRLVLSLFLWGLGEGLWVYIRPLYIAELGGNPVQVGQVLGLTGLAPVLVMIPAGRLVDRFGPRVLMIAGWWVGTLGAMGLALAPDWQWLSVGFFLYAASAFAVPAVNTYVALEVGQRDSSAGGSSQSIQMAVSRIMATYLVGTVISPVLGGWLGRQLGLRSVFWIAAGWFALSLVIVSGLPPLRRPQTHASPDSTAQRAADTSWWRLSVAQIRIYVTLLALFIVMAQGYALVPTYLSDVRALEVDAVGGLGTAAAAGGVIWLALLGKRRSREALVISTVLIMSAMGILLFTPVVEWQLLLMIGMYFLLGSYLTVRPLSLGVVSDHTPPAQRGTSFAFVETMGGVGWFVGSWVAGVLYSRAPDTPFKVTLLALVPLGAVVWLALRSPGRRKKREQQPAAPATGD